MRYFDEEIAKLVRKRMREIIDGVKKSYNVEIELDNREIFDVLINDQQLSEVMHEVASEIVGKKMHFSEQT